MQFMFLSLRLFRSVRSAISGVEADRYAFYRNRTSVWIAFTRLICHWKIFQFRALVLLGDEAMLLHHLRFLVQGKKRLFPYAWHVYFQETTSPAGISTAGTMSIGVHPWIHLWKEYPLLLLAFIRYKADCRIIYPSQTSGQQVPLTYSFFLLEEG
jgi:hypothetical protein